MSLAIQRSESSSTENLVRHQLNHLALRTSLLLAQEGRSFVLPHILVLPILTSLLMGMDKPEDKRKFFDALQLPDVTEDQFCSCVEQTLKDYCGEEKGVAIANAIIHKTPLNPDFEGNFLERFPGSETIAVSKEDFLKDLNNYIETASGGTFKDFFEQGAISDQTLLAIVAVLSLNLEWDVPQERATQGPFLDSSGNEITKEARFMGPQEGSLVEECTIGGVTVIINGVPLENGDIVLHMLPENHTLHQMIEAFSENDVNFQGLVPTKLSDEIVLVPQSNILGYEADLKDLIEKLGIIQEATFNGMFSKQSTPTRLEKACVKTHLTTDKEGLKVQAVAVALISERSTVKLRYFDKPHLSVLLTKDGKVVCLWAIQDANGLLAGAQTEEERFHKMTRNDALERVLSKGREEMPEAPEGVWPMLRQYFSKNETHFTLPDFTRLSNICYMNLQGAMGRELIQGGRSGPFLDGGCTHLPLQNCDQPRYVIGCGRGHRDEFFIVTEGEEVAILAFWKDSKTLYSLSEKGPYVAKSAILNYMKELPLLDRVVPNDQQLHGYTHWPTAKTHFVNSTPHTFPNHNFHYLGLNGKLINDPEGRSYPIYHAKNRLFHLKEKEEGLLLTVYNTETEESTDYHLKKDEEGTFRSETSFPRLS